MSEPATKQDLDEAMGVLRGEMTGEMTGMEARLRSDIDQLRSDMNAMEARLVGELGTFASHVANVVIEQLGRQVSAVDDKYRDLPPRYAELRADFDTHKADLRLHARRPVAPPKRTRRPPSR